MSPGSMITFAFVLLLSCFISSLNAAPAESAPLQKRAVPIAPPAYKLSYTSTGRRASTGASNGGLGYKFVATTGGITQDLVNQCAATCVSTARCGMFQIVSVSGTSSGTVFCSMFSQYVASTKNTYSTGPTGGTVGLTYGFRNLNTPISGTPATTTVAVSTSVVTKPASTVTNGAIKSTVAATTTTSTKVATATFPASPPGGTLVQFAPCSVTKATVPMFVNNQYGGSTSASAYIVQHGSGLNFQDYFTAVYNVIGTNGPIAAPNFYTTSSAVAPNTWYQPSVNLAWQDATYTWSVGNDAVAPSAVACSSYDVYDALLNYYNNKSKFPNLKTVYLVSHSGGASMMDRYSQINNGNYPFHIRYIIANAANHAYYDNARPVSVSNCGTGFVYPFQLASSMPRYVAARFTNAAAIFQRWISRDVVNLVGTYDTSARYPGGVQGCENTAEGGANRRDRNYAWWAYVNILAGTGTNVQAYTGYNQLIASGAKTLYKGTFSQQFCSVDGAGHDQNVMFSSACGRAAMTQTTVSGSAGANYDG